MHRVEGVVFKLLMKRNGTLLSAYQSFFMRNLYFLSAFLLLLSCSQSSRQNHDTSSAKIEIKSTIDSYYDDIRKEGLLAELKYMDSSSQFFWVPPGYLNYAGYDSITVAIRRNAASFKSVDNRYDSLLIIPLTKEYASFVMRTVSTTVDAAGDTSKAAFIESGVMVKRNGGWKFLSGQTSILE